MCLVLPKKIEPRILEEDLVVYKEVLKVSGKIFAKYYNFVYEKDTLYTTEIKESDSFDCYEYVDSIPLKKYALNSGYDIFDTISWKEKSGLFKSFGEGFHSMTRKRALAIAGNICKFLIPKGAIVYEWNGLYVSNKIIMK